jgi:hypothetical protein
MELVIPAAASVAFPTGTHIDVARLGDAGVTVTGATGVTVNATPGQQLREVLERHVHSLRRRHVARGGRPVVMRCKAGMLGGRMKAGALFSWGINQFGEVGNGTTTNVPSPELLGSCSNQKRRRIVYVGAKQFSAVGRRHTGKQICTHGGYGQHMDLC